jgi:uncharacterized integral membrane protein
MDTWSCVPGEKRPELKADDQPLSSAEEEHTELYVHCFYTPPWRCSQTVGQLYTVFTVIVLFILLMQRALLNTADPDCVYLYWRLFLK